MDEQELSQFKKQLESMKVDINSDVEKTLTEMTSQTGNIPDPNDRATMESDRSFELRIEEIADKRLQARPVAKFCIDCKTKQEQKEKEQGR